MKLVIFDLDQTLVDFISVHKKATKYVFKKFFNIKASLTEIDFAGRSLVEVFFKLAKLKGIPEKMARKNIRKMLEFYEKSFIQNFPKNPSKHILPGAKKLLEKLSETENIVVLYTGGSGKIVEKVLTSTDLKRYFRFSFYGTKFKAMSIGVATGFHSLNELSKRNPSYLFKNMKDYKKILKVIR